MKAVIGFVRLSTQLETATANRNISGPAIVMKGRMNSLAL